jgi:hydroxymethylpyrimidine/phosphomethylpyrimidine kinase
MRLAQWQADGDIDVSDAPSVAHALLLGGAQWVLALGAPLRPGHLHNWLLGPDGATFSWPWQAPPERNGDTGGVASAAAAALLAQGLEMPRAVELALQHAAQALATSFLPGMGRRIPNRLAE